MVCLARPACRHLLICCFMQCVSEIQATSCPPSWPPEASTCLVLPMVLIYMGSRRPLPLLFGFDGMLVIVHCFTKPAHFVPAKTTGTAQDLARQFHNNFFSLHGLPNHIISDQEAIFASAWWKEFTALLSTNHPFATAFHAD